LNTFSFGFGELINELPYAREIAQKYQTNHTELTPEKHDLSGLLLKMQEIYDEPFGDSSNIPTYLLAEAARRHTKVVLTGDGGDELFGGYGWYRPLLYSNKNIFKHLPLKADFLYLIAKIISRLPMPGRKFFYHRLFGAAYSRQFGSIFKAHLAANTVFSDDVLKSFGFEKEFFSFDHQPSWKLTNTLDDAMRLDLENYMPGDILAKIDRASMARGLELRAPFLDVDFASFCISLPHQLKISKGIDKYILRKAFGELWTFSIQERDKQGFGAPVNQWLKERPLQSLKNDYLYNPRRKIFSFLPFSQITPFAEKDNYRTWSLLILALWLESHDFDY
jgi:asparagine synthase (glutamine-hydrolysing)